MAIRFRLFRSCNSSSINKRAIYRKVVSLQCKLQLRAYSFYWILQPLLLRSIWRELNCL
ncbi:hypothetical protein GQ55_5G516100 [Panicum hallii var. hallii]|uniref:Uncharacterized protein n=1 Tax=Panicum hallii var. hallii TaxID=1504633 RepID=A0A2T7DSH3_9POAL|nr:hypothetical protein GQ55_5G516100 [Panicum hallii var. hallii]